MSHLQPIFRRPLAGLALALGLAAPCAASERAPEQVGAVYELLLRHSSTSEGSDGSSSSSSGNDALIERVLEVTPAGLVLEYDLATEEELPHGRQDQWQYPFRVFKALDGPVRLLNAVELETRIGPWLEHSEIPRSACGTWIFTWNAFRIECDPQSVIEGVARFDMRPSDLREGASFREPGASGPAQMTEKSAGAEGATYVVELAVDPNWVHREQAESDVVVGEIMGEPVTFEEAVGARSTEEISGTITMTFETDADGGVRRRTKVTELEIRKPDGVVETSTATETLERRLLPPVD
jgi:hypothetical protein